MMRVNLKILFVSFFILTTSCRKVTAPTDQSGKFPTLSRDVKAVLDGGNEVMSDEIPVLPKEKEFILNPDEKQCEKIRDDIYEKGRAVCFSKTQEEKERIIKQNKFDFAQAAVCPDPDEKKPLDISDGQRNRLKKYAGGKFVPGITLIIIRHINAKSFFCNKGK